MKLAGIDIGSNAVRLLIMEITERDSNPDKTVFTKDVLVRAPLRLGEQVFVKGYLMDDNKSAGKNYAGFCQFDGGV